MRSSGDATAPRTKRRGNPTPTGDAGPKAFSKPVTRGKFQISSFTLFLYTDYCHVFVLRRPLFFSKSFVFKCELPYHTQQNHGVPSK